MTGKRWPACRRGLASAGKRPCASACTARCGAARCPSGLVVDRPVLIQGQLGLHVGLSLDRVADLLRGVEGAALPSVDLVPLRLELIPDHRSADISVMEWLMEPAVGELVWAMDSM